jgi:hypothetical protein
MSARGPSRSTSLAALAAALLVGCGDNLDAPPDAGEPAAEPDANVRPQPPELGPILDRMGRPMTSHLLIGTAYDDAEQKRLAQREYDRAEVDRWHTFEAELERNVALFDGLDNRTSERDRCNNLEAPYDDLAQLLANDQLFVDTASGNCDAYFAVERTSFGAQSHASCGGRAPSYDVIDLIYSEVVKGASLPMLSDGVGPHGDHSDSAFPFLGPPHP